MYEYQALVLCCVYRSQHSEKFYCMVDCDDFMSALAPTLCSLHITQTVQFMFSSVLCQFFSKGLNEIKITLCGFPIKCI